MVLARVLGGWIGLWIAGLGSSLRGFVSICSVLSTYPSSGLALLHSIDSRAVSTILYIHTPAVVAPLTPYLQSGLWEAMGQPAVCSIYRYSFSLFLCVGLQNRLTSSLSCWLGQSGSMSMWVRVPGSKVSDHGSSKGVETNWIGYLCAPLRRRGLFDNCTCRATIYMII